MKTICITSGKGGVGKTTLALNLGLAMQEGQRRVLLLDGDLGLANLNVMLGLAPRFTIQDVIAQHMTLAQVVTTTPYGIDLISGGSGIAELADLSATARERLLHGLDSLDGYDTLLIDTGAGINDTVIRFILASRETLIVTTPHPTALADAYGVIKTVLTREPHRFLLVINAANSAAEARQVAARLIGVTEKFMPGSLSPLGYVPRDPLIERSILDQIPHVLQHPNSPSARQIHAIARRLSGETPTQERTGFKHFLRRLVGQVSEPRVRDPSAKFPA